MNAKEDKKEININDMPSSFREILYFDNKHSGWYLYNPFVDNYYNNNWIKFCKDIQSSINLPYYENFIERMLFNCFIYENCFKPLKENLKNIMNKITAELIEFYKIFCEIEFIDEKVCEIGIVKNIDYPNKENNQNKPKLLKISICKLQINNDIFMVILLDDVTTQINNYITDKLKEFEALGFGLTYFSLNELYNNKFIENLYNMHRKKKTPIEIGESNLSDDIIKKIDIDSYLDFLHRCQTYLDFCLDLNRYTTSGYFHGIDSALI
jgi:hypothetical protein